MQSSTRNHRVAHVQHACIARASCLQQVCGWCCQSKRADSSGRALKLDHHCYSTAHGGLVTTVCCSCMHGFMLMFLTVHAVCMLQLDGFGHSRTEPLLKSMGGFDAIFFGRCEMTQALLWQPNVGSMFRPCVVTDSPPPSNARAPKHKQRSYAVPACSQNKSPAK